MTRHDARVRKAQLPDQQDLIDHPEHCSATVALLDSIGRVLGQQVRVRRTGVENQVALYTVCEVRDEGTGNDDIVRMGEQGRERVGTASAFDDGQVDSDCVSWSGYVDTASEACPLPGMETPEETAAADAGEFIELVCHDGTNAGLIVIAPHGGLIEEHTDNQAKHVVATLADSRRRASLWLCQGWNGGVGAHDRWHITSTDINPENFPGLEAIFSTSPPFTYAVSFHGFERRDDEPHVCIGGSAPLDLQEDIRDEIVAATGDQLVVVIVDADDDGDACARFPGDATDNIVNRLGSQGIQIEQSWEARDEHWQDIAGAVATVFEILIAVP